MDKTIRAKPTKEEAEILLNAQGEIIREGQTAIRCPRCGKQLEYRWNASGESIYCMGEKCIIVETRGI